VCNFDCFDGLVLQIKKKILFECILYKLSLITMDIICTIMKFTSK